MLRKCFIPTKLESYINNSVLLLFELPVIKVADQVLMVIIHIEKVSLDKAYPVLQ